MLHPLRCHLRPRRRLPRALLPLLVLSSSLWVEGCQTAAPGAAPASTLQTFETLYSSAVSADDLVIKTATTAFAAGLINTAQAKKVLMVTDQVKAALDAANTAAQVGNSGLATGNLAAAMGPIALLSACLTVKPLTVASFDTCSATLKPLVLP